MIPKVLVDCDPGLDDTMSIFMLIEAHRNKKIQLIGITVVNGNSNVENCTKNVLRVLEVSNISEIPVFVGACQPLVVPFVFPEYPFHGKDGFGDTTDMLISQENLDKNCLIAKEHAATAISRLIEENPGEVIVVAIGPLTNIALVLNFKPQVFLHLKDFYVMGGNISGEGNITEAGEFNFAVDPEAAKVVLDRMPLQIKMVPWESCAYSIEITYKERKILGSTNSPASKLMNKIEAKNMEEERFGHYVTCDQIAVAWLLDEYTTESPTFVIKTEKMAATVEVAGFKTRGMMVVNRRQGPHIVKKLNVLALRNYSKDVYMEYLKMAFV